MKRLVLIDGHAILHRAFHALPPLTTSKGEMINAVFGFITMLLRVINDLKPTHLIVTFDRPKPTFRKKIYENYQAKRPKMDEGLISQIDIVHKVVSEMGIPIFEMDGYEADDIIGTLIQRTKNKEQRTEKEDIENIIVTGDRDILQLVDAHTKVYMPVKGLSESKLYGEREVEEKFGIKASQMVDYKALVGDPSDNYPGVAGIGPKTAASLLSQFKTLEQLYQKLDRVDNEGLRKKLKESAESAEMAKKLATIVTDVPIEINLDRCQLKNFDRPNVHHLFEELEFRSLIPRLSGGIKNNELRSKRQKKEEKSKENKVQQTTLF